MKILLVSATYEGITHGPAKFVNQILGHPEFQPPVDIRLLTMDVSDPIKDKVYKYKRTYPRIIGVFWEYYDNILYARKITKIYKTFPFDILIFNNALTGLLSTFIFRNKAKTIGFINDDSKMRNGILKLSLTKNWFKKFIARILEKGATRSMDAIVLNSIYMKNFLKNEYKIKRDKLSILYKGVYPYDFEFVDQRAIDSGQSIKILFVKYNYVVGGLEYLIRALKNLNEYRFQLSICGPDTLSHTISRLLKSFPIEWQLYPRISQDSVLEKMKNHDILCTPSLREALGVANIEGLASGISIVSTNVGGIPEVLNHGANGWMSNPNNAEALANKIKECIENPEERIKRSQNGRIWVEEQFDINQNLSDFIELLKTLSSKNTI